MTRQELLDELLTAMELLPEDPVSKLLEEAVMNPCYTTAEEIASEISGFVLLFGHAEKFIAYRVLDPEPEINQEIEPPNETH